MVENISFCGARGRYIPNKFVEKATMGELAEAINRGIDDASKIIGQKIQTVEGKRMTGKMLAEANSHLIKNGHLTDEGFEALGQMYKLDNLDLGGLRKKVSEIAATNAYAESTDTPAILSRSFKYFG